MIDLVNGLLTLCSLLLKVQSAIDDVADGFDEFPYFYQLYKEYMDNFVQSVAAIDWAEVFSEIGQGFVDLMDAIPEKLQKLSAAEVGYYSGYIAFNNAEFFFPVLKIAKLAKAGKLAEGFAEMVADMQKVAQNMANAGRKVGKAVSQAPKKAYDFALDMLDNLLALLRQGTATVKELVQKMFERIRAWLDEALNTLENELLFFNKQRLHRNAYLNILPLKGIIKIFTLPLARVLRKGGLQVVDLGEEYILRYKGKSLFQGSKSEIKDFLDPYKDVPKKDFRAILDDLSNASRFTQLSKKALSKLMNRANQALKLSKRKRPNVCAVLEGPDGTIIVNTSYKGNIRDIDDYPIGLHRLVREWLESQKLRSALGEVKISISHGNCAEVLNISEWLKIIDPLEKMTIEQAKAAFQGFKSHARKIATKTKDDIIVARHLYYWEACATCNPLLKHFEIQEVI